MKSFSARFLVALSVALSTISCGEKESGHVPFLEVTFAEMTVANSTPQVYVKVSSNVDWTLSTSDAWQGVSFKEQGSARTETFKGTGTRTNVILNLGENLDEEARTLVVRAEGEGLTALAVLTQKGTASSEDVDVVTSMGGRMGSAPFHWMELPATNASDGFDFVYHNATIEGTLKRNYSLYWDFSNKVAHWVAYPLNAGYKSNGSRPKPEPWALDPFLSADEQPVLYSGFAYGNIPQSSGNASHPDRGHQLPSADRYSGDSNTQTYYSTNMTPQYNAFNTQIWLNLETKVRDWAVAGLATDTLYVVTGCTVGNSSLYALDNDGKKVTVPSAYFKAVLRYAPSSTIAPYTGCAIFLDHRTSFSDKTLKNYAISIDELEEKLGTDLFVNLPAAIGQDKADAVEAENPTKNNWWWSH